MRKQEEHRKLREQLIRLCKDDSLAYEIFSFVPEIYCKYAYPKVEYGARLFLIQKDQNAGAVSESAAILLLYRRNGYGAFEKGSCKSQHCRKRDQLQCKCPGYPKAMDNGGCSG